MKNKICLILVVLLFTVFGLGSGSSSESKTKTTTVDGDSTSETTSSSKSSDNLDYEITNVIHDEYDSGYGLGMHYYIILEVTNTGDVPMYLDDCTIDYEDDNGHLLQTGSYFSKVPDIVEPGEKGYFYGGASFDDDVSFDNGCNIVPNVTIDKANGSLKSYETTDITVYDGKYGGVGIKGRIINDTDEDVDYIYITTVFYDADGQVLDISGTSVTDVKANSKTSFDDSGMMEHVDFSASDVASYRIYCDEMYFQF